MLAAEVFCIARAGASDPAFHRPTKRSTLRVPKARRLPEREARLQDLYVRGESVMARVLDGQARSELERLHRQLQLDFPDEWLLRWNLLETLLKLGERHGLSSELQGELEALEVRYEHREPITSGLRYLARAFSLNSSRPPC